MKYSKRSFLSFVAVIFFILPAGLAHGETTMANGAFMTPKGLDATSGTTIPLNDIAEGVQLGIDLKILPSGEHGFPAPDLSDCGSRELKDK